MSVMYFSDISNPTVLKKFALVTENGTVDDDSIKVINKFLKKYKDLHSDIHKIFHMSVDYMVVMIELSGSKELLLPEESNNVFANYLQVI